MERGKKEKEDLKRGIEMKRWGKAILILSLIVVWGGGLLPKHAEWRNLQYRLSFRDGRFAFGEQFDDAYGEVGVGPSLDLPEGEYVLTLQTDAEAEYEVVFLKGIRI